MFILASSSPRRISILQRLGIPLRVVPPRYEVNIETSDPYEKARLIALEKARSVAGLFTEGIVIAADTIVVIDNMILGKPKDVSEAEKFLQMLSGRDHIVITGLALIDSESMKEVVNHSETKVWFRTLDDKDIEWYLRTGEPFDKAGGYAIQGFGAFLVERIDGDFWNIVGFPLPLFYRLLKEEFGINLFDFVKCTFSLV